VSTFDLDSTAERLRAFARERDWEQYHSPKNLAMALAAEAGELLEIFQWRTATESAPESWDPTTRDHVAEEVADVLIYLVRLADVSGIDLADAVDAKITRNAQRFPPGMTDR